MMAAAGAIIASAAAGALAPDAGAKKRKKAPVIQSVAPKNVSIGETLTIRGKNFVRGRDKNTVVFKRDNSKAVFVKAEVGTRKLLRVTVPTASPISSSSLDGTQIATPFRLRVLAKKLSKKFTTGSLVPLIGPEKPPAPETSRARASRTATATSTRSSTRRRRRRQRPARRTPPRSRSRPTRASRTPTRTVSTDGYEFQSSVDLNDDEYQEPQPILPAPARSRTRTRCSRREHRLRRRLAHPQPGVRALEGLPQPRRAASTTSSTPTATSTRPTARDGSGRRPGGLVGADPNQKSATSSAGRAAAGYGDPS